MKNTTIRHIAKKALTITGKALIFCLEKGGDFVFEIEYPGLCNLMGHEGAMRFLDRKYGRIPPSIRNLKRNRWINAKQIGDKILIKLTESGKIAALQLQIAKCVCRLPTKSVLLVAFDIPEAATETRRTFRNALKRMGFKRIQMSVWSTDRDVAGPLIRYIKILGISDWIMIYNANKLL